MRLCHIKRVYLARIMWLQIAAAEMGDKHGGEIKKDGRSGAKGTGGKAFFMQQNRNQMIHASER